MADGSQLSATLGRYRFAGFLAVLALAATGLSIQNPQAGWRDIVVTAFDVAALSFFASLMPLLLHNSTAAMRHHSHDNDLPRVALLGLTTLLTIMVMLAITGELPLARNGNPAAVLKLVGTLLLTWLFGNSVYTLHYAHVFYGSGRDRGGINFPGTPAPDYLDFAYFAFTLGMTFQTSDISITRRGVRRVVLLHCFAAFIFNLGVIAFTINTLSGSG